MESEQILTQAQAGAEPPESWIVLPLSRQKVIIGILGWIFATLLGGLIFAFLAPIMVPYNYQSGVGAAIVTTLVLGILLFICLGSIWALIIDIQRLSHAREHIIVITPKDFVKQAGKKIIHVPLENVKYVTARGKAPVNRDLYTAHEETNINSAGENVSSFIFGRRAIELTKKGISRKRARVPSTLAFIDSRTDSEVIVTTDKAFGEPHLIAAHLKAYAESAQRRSVV
jgi:hypothetical protein